MRKSLHLEKVGRLLILSWNFGFGISISKSLEIHGARDLMANSFSLERKRRLHVCEFQNSEIPEIPYKFQKFQNSEIPEIPATWNFRNFGISGICMEFHKKCKEIHEIPRNSKENQENPKDP